jgi:hypothetical protein
MTMNLPPGIRFLGRTLLVPSFLFLLIQGTATHPSYGLGLPMWAAPIVAILAAVAFAVLWNTFTWFSHARAAEARGARPVPCAKGTWPGSVDLLRTMLAAYKTGYLGRYLDSATVSKPYRFVQVTALQPWLNL